jgi:hypothetical protein
MLKLGWDKRPGVTILFGRWQDVMPQLKARRYDGIFFDTYGGGAGGGGRMGLAGMGWRRVGPQAFAPPLHLTHRPSVVTRSHPLSPCRHPPPSPAR